MSEKKKLLIIFVLSYLELFFLEVDKGLEMLDFLREQNLSASTRSNNLHSVCDDLMTKMSSMNEMKNEIEAKEKVFKNADKVVTQSNHTLNPESLCSIFYKVYRIIDKMLVNYI